MLDARIRWQSRSAGEVPSFRQRSAGSEMGRLRLFACLLAVLLLWSAEAGAQTLQDAYEGTIEWLESSQNSDGSWSTGARRWVATSEALLGLALAGRENATAANRAKAWLLNHEAKSTDARARAIRALAIAGVDMRARAESLLEEASTYGWRPHPEALDAEWSSMDTALAIEAVFRSGVANPNVSLQSVEVTQAALVSLPGGSQDAYWPGRNSAGAAAQSPDIGMTAEIMRALAGRWAEPWPLGSPDPRDHLRAPVSPSDPDQLLLMRWAALHADEEANSAIESEVLSRLGPGDVWGSDPLTNAIGLIALATHPTASFTPYVGPADLDGDGIADSVDTDTDGDGVLDSQDDFPLDPDESTDTDGDGTGDLADTDDDGDGIDDDLELQDGTDPLSADSDGDGHCDGPQIVSGCTDANDPCPLAANQSDGDGDTVCPPLDECDGDPTGYQDLNGDGECDVSDDDDDGDGALDIDEFAAGTDPRDDASVPGALDASADLDGDGLTNGVEQTQAQTSPYRSDTDRDGHTDYYEFHVAGGDPLDPQVQPDPGAPGAISAMTPADQPELSGTDPTPAAAMLATLSGAQSTPVSPGPNFDSPTAIHIPGFQAQTWLGRDLDGDGLTGSAEAAQGTSGLLVDTDGDLFVDGSDGPVSKAVMPTGRDMDGDGNVDGELDLGTDPADATSRPGRPGDVAPLFYPDGEITWADVMVRVRISEEATLIDDLQTSDHRDVISEGADVDEDGDRDLGDVIQLMNEATTP